MPTGVYKRNPRPKKPYKLMTEAEFLTKIKVDENGCWIWQRSKSDTGYGHFYHDGKTVLAHRWAYEHWVGPIQPNSELDHLCRNRACVNPSPRHLEAVSHKVNVLRGTAPGAIAHVTQRCKRGHDISGVNAYRSPNGRVNCRFCRRINDNAKEKVGRKFITTKTTLTPKEQAVLKKFKNGEYHIHAHLNTTETRSEVAVLQHLERKGLVESEWLDSLCAAGNVKAFYLKKDSADLFGTPYPAPVLPFVRSARVKEEW
jgi:hypothetical protein